ncbi:MAG: hypothetical protein FWH41_01050 [Treponema sp.]|nr:hypothetical protein [Treponema sp.]
MKKITGLAVFFCLSFLTVFLAAAGLRFLVLRIEWVQAFSRQQETVLAELILACRWALSFALFCGILLGLNYTVRKSIFAPYAILCIVLLSFGLTFGTSMGLQGLEGVQGEKKFSQSLGGPGMILFSPERPTGTAFVLLDGPANPGSPRVAAVPGKSMQYQAEFSGRDIPVSSLPLTSFGINTPWFMKNLSIDFRLNAETLQRRFNEGILSFLIYAGALILLLSSFLFIQKFSTWPLANLFLGCLVFWGILSLETFLNTREIQSVFGSFLKNRFPVSYAVPVIFIVFALLAFLFSFLTYIAKRQKKYGI